MIPLPNLTAVVYTTVNVMAVPNMTVGEGSHKSKKWPLDEKILNGVFCKQ